MNIQRFLVGIFVGTVMVASTAHVSAAFDAVCSPDFDQQFFTEKPAVSSALCTVGTPSGTIEGHGTAGAPWKWHCFDDEGNQGSRCEAFLSLCGNDVLDAGEQCDGESGCSAICEMTATCAANLDRKEVSQEPVENLCDLGIASGVTGQGTSQSPWAWTCVDVAGNIDAQCNATQVQDAPTVETVTESEAVVETIVETPLPDITVVPEAVAVSQEDNTNNELVQSGDFTPAAACGSSDYSDIKGYIWHDADRDGKRDSDEDGIDDVSVELYNADKDEVEQDKTNSDGKFSFRDYAPGKYTIDVKSSDSDLDGYHLVYEPDNNLNGKDQITLKCDNDHTGTSFGYDDGEKTSTGSNRPSTLAQTGGSLLHTFVSLLGF